jgi:hypothetical protein
MVIEKQRMEWIKDEAKGKRRTENLLLLRTFDTGFGVGCVHMQKEGAGLRGRCCRHFSLDLFKINPRRPKAFESADPDLYYI